MRRAAVGGKLNLGDRVGMLFERMKHAKGFGVPQLQAPVLMARDEEPVVRRVRAASRAAALTKSTPFLVSR
jgi:hypothetical protein